jgi:RNA polymerase sigma-70 factor (ECF subfamily)
MENEKQIEAQSVNDEEVVDRVLKGEKGAYELIMRKYNQRLFRIARAYLQDEDEIEDIIQEAYINAYEHLPRFEKRSAFSTWLIRILINEALARVKHRRRFASMTSAGPEDHDVVPEQMARVANKEIPTEKLMNAELKTILEHSVDRLPEKYKSVFVMREIEGMSVAETSDSLDISEPNVKVRLNRAKEMLRETISGFYQDEEVFHFNLVRCDRIVENVLRRI